MATSRISKRPDTLRDLLNQASAAATAAGLSWPTTAPTPAALTAAADAIDTNITNIDAFDASIAVERQSRNGNVTTGYALAQDVDEVTDMLYGPDGAEKLNFGLSPKGSGSIAALAKLTDLQTYDGLLPGSIRFDFENIEGATYEVQWSLTSDFAEFVGTAVSTQSEYMIAGLTSGTQYWMRVRPVRGGQLAAWSDPATRVAPV